MDKNLQVIQGEDTQEIIIDEETLKALSQNVTNDENSDFEFLFSPMELDEDRLEEISKTKEYLEGEAIASKYLGIWNTLVNGGVDLTTASAIVINTQALNHQINLQKVVNEGYKYQQNLSKQTQL